MSIDLKRLIPKTIRNDFYGDMLDAISAELELFKTDLILPKKDTFNIRNLTDSISLQEIATTFGYKPNVSLDSSISFLKEEIGAISYRIKRKTTYSGYQRTFDTIPILGYVYNMLWDGQSLVKAINFSGKSIINSLGTGDGSTKTFSITLSDYLDYLLQSITIFVNGATINVSASNAATEVLTTSPNIGSGTYVRSTGLLTFTFITAPALGYPITANYQNNTTDINTLLATWNFANQFTQILPQYYYSFFENIPFLDDGHTLDEGLFLDTNALKETTHHLAIEVIPTSLITVSAVEYLMTSLYLDYILYYAQYNRKVTEVPHVGVQVCLPTDDSRLYNNLSGTTYTVDAIKAKFAVTQNYAGVVGGNKNNMFYTLVAGTGVQTMWHIGQTPGTISALTNQIFSKQLSSNESDETGTFYKVNSYIPNRNIANTTIMTGDDVTFTKSGTTGYLNIVPHSVYLTYTANNQLITVNDTTGLGIITSSDFAGVVNYATGVYSFNFVNTASDANVISGSGNPTVITNAQLSQTTIIKESVVVNYFYNGSQLQLTFDSSGNAIIGGGSFVVSGTVTSLGVVNIAFSVVLDSVNLTTTFQYSNYSIPTLNTPVLLSYKTIDSVEITEFGVKDSNGDLILYGIIPPCLIADRDYQISLELFIKK